MANLKKLFPEFYQSNLSELDLAKKNDNLIVLDTNYLLDILQSPTTIAKEYIEAIEKVKDNLYIPYLVALEFNFKKSSQKKGKIKEIQKYKDTLINSTDKIKQNINAIELVDKKEKDDFTNEMLDLTKQYTENLKKIMEQKIESMITKEESVLYEKLISIIEDQIGEKYTQEWIDQVEKEGVDRYNNKIPPGFDDDAKEKEVEEIRNYGDLKYQRKFGDLLIWKDIIEYSKNCNKSGRKVILVTNDGKSKKKNDLLYKINDFIVGPKIHLMNELQIYSNKEFYILDNLRFVQMMNNLTDEEIDKFKTNSIKSKVFSIDIDTLLLTEKFQEKFKKLDSIDENFDYKITKDGNVIQKKTTDINDFYLQELLSKSTQRLFDEQMIDYLKNKKAEEDLIKFEDKLNFLKKSISDEDKERFMRLYDDDEDDE